MCVCVYLCFAVHVSSACIEAEAVVANVEMRKEDKYAGSSHMHTFALVAFNALCIMGLGTTLLLKDPS